MAEGRIMEIKTVVRDSDATNLLSQGWELYTVVASAQGEYLWGYHLVKRSGPEESEGASHN
jgi:hypothetical protein